MKKIPIAFCFDDNLILPAAVCLTSLLKNSLLNTYYDIYILHNDKCKYQNSNYLEKLHNEFNNFSITYRSVGEAFNEAYEIRGITIAAYYRLLIPQIIPEYDKIFYFDVDIIFRNDLSELYNTIDLEDNYVAGVSTPYSDITNYVNETIGMDISKYICSGTMILNSKKINQDNLIEKFKETAAKNLKYQDQDTINIVCNPKIKILDPWFGIVGTVSEIISNKNQIIYSKEQADYALNYGIIHFNGNKPWKTWCYNFDIWWEYYRYSVFFDPEFYHEFYHNRLNEYDSLSLWKRVKILLRYFKN